jgi:DNA-binding GntR family transcriptional regulator
MLRPSLSDKAYAQIREWIIRYHLKPGAHLRFGELAETLGMSQTPVREAVRKLEQENLVERHPTQGRVVRPLYINDVSDIYDVRLAMEVLAVTQAARRLSPEDTSRLADILQQVKALIATKDKGRILSLEQDFHMVILKASGNRYLSEIGCGILDRIWMIQNVNVMTSENLVQAHEQHEEIFEALKRSEPRKAAALMRRHLTMTKKLVLDQLGKGGFLSLMIIGPPLDNSARPDERAGAGSTGSGRGRRLGRPERRARSRAA